MIGQARIAPPDMESRFHSYDRALGENLALRAVHGRLESDDGRAPTGAPLGVLVDENARMRAALERRGVPLPRAPAGAVQPTELLEPPRRHVPSTDPAACPACGTPGSGGVCRCGYIRGGGPAPRPSRLRRRLALAGIGRTTLPEPHAPFRPKIGWDYVLAWVIGIKGIALLTLWAFGAFLR